MDYLTQRFLERYVLVPVISLLLLFILVAGMLIWEKIKAKWQEWKLSKQ